MEISLLQAWPNLTLNPLTRFHFYKLLTETQNVFFGASNVAHSSLRAQQYIQTKKEERKTNMENCIKSNIDAAIVPFHNENCT